MDHSEPKLCLRCSALFRSGGEGVLFDPETINELSPKTCSLCAIIEFDCSLHPDEIVKIVYFFEAEAPSERWLRLWFYAHSGYVRNQRLHMLPLKSEPQVFTMYNN